MSAKEIWLTIKHNDNYEVSNLGNIYESEEEDADVCSNRLSLQKR